MSGFVIGFALCGSLVACGAVRLYELQCEDEEKLERRLRAKARKLRKKRKTRSRSSSPAARDSSPVGTALRAERVSQTSYIHCFETVTPGLAPIM